MAALRRGHSAGLLLVIICFGLAVRLYGADGMPIWIDEAYSYWSASQSWTALWTIVPRFETHPPLFYSLVKLWLPLGDSEQDLRLLPTLLGIMAVPLLYLSGRIVGGRACGLLAATLIACAPWQIIQAQNLRPYTLVTLASALVMAGALQILNNPALAAEPLWRPAKIRIPMLAAYAALSMGLALLLWSHNLNILLCGSVGLFLLIWWHRNGRSRALLHNLLLAGLVAVLLYLPNLPSVIGQFGVVHGGWWLTPPSLPNLAAQSLELFGFPLYGSRPSVNLLFNAALLLPYAGGVILAWRTGGTNGPRRRSSISFLAACAIGPWLAAILITFLLVPVFLDRTLTMVQVPACLLLASAPLGLSGLSRGQRRLGQFVLFAIPVMVAIGFHLRDLRANDADRGWKDIVTAIAANAKGTPPVFTVPNASAIPLTYYTKQLNHPLNLVPVPAPYPAPGYARYPSGNRAEPAIEPEHLAGIERVAQGRSEVWVVARAIALFDPSGSIDRLLSHRFACRTYYYGSARQSWMIAIRYHAKVSGQCGVAPSP